MPYIQRRNTEHDLLGKLCYSNIIVRSLVLKGYVMQVNATNVNDIVYDSSATQAHTHTHTHSLIVHVTSRACGYVSF